MNDKCSKETAFCAVCMADMKRITTNDVLKRVLGILREDMKHCPEQDEETHTYIQELYKQVKALGTQDE